MYAEPHDNGYTEHNRVKLLRGGKPYFDELLGLINSARQSIYLQSYIYDEDETGIAVADALIRAAKRQVRVFVLLDAYASGHLSDEFKDKLRSSGVWLKFFEPLLRTVYAGRRLHAKILVADEVKSIVGGINISNRYNDMPGHPAWLDWAIFTEGEASLEIYRYAMATWEKATKRRVNKSNAVQYEQSVNTLCKVRVRRNDWLNNLTQVTKSYREMFRTAQHEVVLMSSYFWPGRNIMRKIAYASGRGVKIKLILSGTSDVPIAKQAERYLYRWMIRNKIEIYEYQANVLHGKIAVKDSNWVTAGSYNVNNISAYASIELNLDVKNNAFALEVNQALSKIITDSCTPVDPLKYKHAGIFKKFGQFCAYQVVHLIFFMFTFYFKQSPRRY